MSIVYRRRKRIGRHGTSVNLSGGGLSVSQRIGQRLTLNSRGGGSIRLGHGFSYRFRWLGRR